MNKIDNSGEGIARLGRNEDSMLAHVAPGEMVVPPVISPLTQQAIQQEMMAVGLDPNEYTVGQGMSINPITGMAEFGFLKKLGKSLKKVVKKVAPIAAVALPFIPGFQALTPALKGLVSGAVGKAGGASTKDALLGGLTAGLGAKFAGSGSGGKLKGLKGLKGSSGKFFGADGTFRNILGAGKEFVLPGEDNKGLFKNLFGDRLGSGQMGAGGQQEIVYQDENGNIYTESQVNEMIAAGNMPGTLTEVQTGIFGGTLGPKLKNFFLGNQQQGQGGLLSGLGQIGQIGQGQGGMLGGNAGLAALAALYGAAVKKQAEKREGGLRDIRASRRPDLAPQPVFQGFDLGVRPGMAYGGTAMGRPGFANGGPLNPDLFELDYRQVGGPTIGIGTGTSDDIPAMLSDGEYVFTASANNGAGAFDISKSKDSIMLIPDGKPNREKGAKNLGMLMDMFEDTDKRLS